ncbi:hypothetical protein AB0M38_15255 [Streptomyces sp. NPDC051742]|uniref:hypothetical protein n=1 Tax=unclassified Streptomyces TaxID=2593676 RepID=UPI003422606F
MIIVIGLRSFGSVVEMNTGRRTHPPGAPTASTLCTAADPKGFSSSSELGTSESGLVLVVPWVA